MRYLSNNSSQIEQSRHKVKLKQIDYHCTISYLQINTLTKFLMNYLTWFFVSSLSFDVLFLTRPQDQYHSMIYRLQCTDRFLRLVALVYRSIISSKKLHLVYTPYILHLILLLILRWELTPKFFQMVSFEMFHLNYSDKR
jgi:hypothetical protein